MPPIYELECSKCLIVYEVLCKLADLEIESIIVCDDCHTPLKRIISSVNFIIDRATDG
jgi:putative FmdB family regulatory protein